MGFIRRIFGRDVDSVTSRDTGRVLTADAATLSGVKWASPLPIPPSAGQVIKSYGNTEGDYDWDSEYSFDLPAPASVGQVLTATGTNVGEYAWGADFELPTAASSGQVLTATGIGAGDYAWSAAPSNLWFTNHTAYETPGIYTFTAAAGSLLRILLISGGGSLSPATITENSVPLLEAGGGGFTDDTTYPQQVGHGEFFDHTKISPIRSQNSEGGIAPRVLDPLLTTTPGAGHIENSNNGVSYAGSFIEAYYRNTTGSAATLEIILPGGYSGTGPACLIQYN